MLPNLTAQIVTAQPSDGSQPPTMYVVVAHQGNTLFLVNIQGGVFSSSVMEVPIADGDNFGWRIISYQEDDVAFGAVIDSLTNILVATNFTLTRDGRLSARITRDALVACFREKRLSVIKAVRAAEDMAKTEARAEEDRNLAEYYEKLARNPNPAAEEEPKPYAEQAYGTTDAPCEITIGVKSDDPAVTKRVIENIRQKLNPQQGSEGYDGQS